VKPSKDCIDLIKFFEGYHTLLPNGDCKTYLDPGSLDGKPYTIGWGSTRYRTSGLAKYGRHTINLKDTLTRQEAEQELMAAIEVAAASVNRMTKKLTQSQFDAATSFVFNAGPNTKQKERLEAGELEGFAKALPLYNKGGSGKVLAGLVARRKAELELWNKDKGASPVTTPTWIALTRKSGDKPKNIFRAMNAANVMSEQVWESREDLVKLLTAVPSAGTAVVTVEDWEPEGEAVKPTPVSVATLSRTGKKEAKGCEELKLVIGDQSFICRSGQPWAQVFEQGNMNNVPGSMRPLPAGKWKIGSIEFAGGKDNYEADWSEAIGPVWVGLEPMFKTRRSAIGIHIDGNAYGTAGCLGARNMTDLKGIVAALRKYNPKILDVVW
jgi:lysozyme